MATQTTNLHLTKPDGSEKVNIATINTNMDTIDTYAGTNNASIINLAEDIGVVVNGNKTKSGVTAAVGQYVILKNSTISNRVDGLYTAAKAIPANTAIDASYLTAVSGGGLNALNAKITTFGGKMAYETSSNVQDADIVDVVKGFINNGSKGGTFLASRCTNTPNASLYYKIRYTKVDGSSWVMLEAWNTSDTSLYYINEMNPSTDAIGTWKQYALKSDVDSRIQSGRVTDVTLAANAQTEITVTLPISYNSGTDYSAVANIEYYGSPSVNSACLIRNKLSGSFVIRVYNSGAEETGVVIDWVVVKIS